MNKKDTVVFDLDGTLLDTLEDLKNSVNYAMRHFDYPERTLDEVRRFVGNGIVLLIQRAIPGGKDDPNFEEAFALFKEHYGKHCNDTTKPYEGIMELLHILKEHNIKIAIVSNKADFAVKELNEIYFKGMISVAIGEKESEGIRKKPAPDTVREALKELGSTAESSVYVGDSDVDIETARNSGMDEILCDWGFRGEEFLLLAIVSTSVMSLRLEYRNPIVCRFKRNIMENKGKFFQKKFPLLLSDFSTSLR